MMAPLFTAVVILLSIGAMGELLESLFKKVKNLLMATSPTTQTSVEQTVELK